MLAAPSSIIERGTRFHSLYRTGALTLPEDDVQADLFELTQTRLEAANLPAYEISNHAAPGEACRHNLIYWQAGDYTGIGPGAHGRLTIDGQRWSTETEAMPRAWLERVERQGHGELPRETLTRRDQVVEMILMGLRLANGIDVRRVERLSGRPLAETLNGSALDMLLDDGWLKVEQQRLVATASGRLRLNAILAALLDLPDHSFDDRPDGSFLAVGRSSARQIVP